MSKERSRFVPFYKLKLRQLFAHDNAIWIKDKRRVCGDFEYNSYKLDSIDPNHLGRCIVDVRFFDSPVLVNVGPEDKFFDATIKAVNLFANDN